MTSRYTDPPLPYLTCCVMYR